MQPLGLHDGDQGVTGILVCGKVGSGRDDMSEFVDRREGRGRFMNDDLAAVLLDQDSQLNMQAGSIYVQERS